MTSWRLEAEAMTLAGGYVTESGTFASGGGLIRILDTASVGTATATFTLETGTYDIVVGYYDESDGKSPVTLKIGDFQDSWVFDNSPGGTRASATNFKTRTISGVSISQGSLIELTGYLNSGEVARIDYIEFIPTSGSGGGSTPPTNTAPTANSDSYTTAEDTVLNIAAGSGVLSNDSDVDGDALTASLSSNSTTQGGTVTMNADGSFSYTPASGFTGADSFSYSISDGKGGTASATVSIAVNPAGTATPTAFRLEAETMALSGGYVTESGTFASAGGLIRVLDTATSGTATATFAGVSGVYDVIVGYYDESDGKSPVTLKIGDFQDSWVFDNSPGGTRASATNFKTRTISGVSISQGSLIDLTGYLNSGEVARIDYIEFIPSGSSGGGSPPPANAVPTASLTAADFGVVEGSQQSYFFTVTYRDDTAIDISTLDNSDIRIQGPNGQTSLATLVSVSSTSNGTPRTATYAIAPFGGTWDAADAGTYQIYLENNQVSDANGQFAVGGALGSFQVSLTATTIDGTPDDDVLVGNSFNNLIRGFGGNDTLVSGGGRNTLDGGEGSDTVDYSGAKNGIVADLGAGTVFLPLYGSMAQPKIMPLGDSITAGQHSFQPYPGAYRIQMWDRYQGDGLSLDFVGSQSNGPSQLGDKDHEGRPGWNINKIRNLVNDSTQQLLQTHRPDVVLLMIGANDINNSRTLTQMRTDLSNLIDSITQKSPDAYLVVSSLTPMDPAVKGEGKAQKVKDFNALLPDLVNQKVAQGKNVHLVNAGGSLSLSDMLSDGLHPTAAGYHRLGDAWYDSLIDKDALKSIENIIGSAFKDTITGSPGANVIRGGTGDDLLTGGGGADAFVYKFASEGGDRITDWGSDDRFEISASGFGGGLVAGVALSSSNASTGVLVSDSNPTAQGSSANFLYNTLTGLLSFDIDGTGSQQAVAIATLNNAPALSVNQFVITA